MQFILYPLASILFYSLVAFLPQVGVISAVFSPLLILLYLDLPKRNRFSDFYLAGLIAVLGGFIPILAGFYLIAVIFPALFIQRYLKTGRREQWVPSVLPPLGAFFAVFIAVFLFKQLNTSMTDVAQEGIETIIKALQTAKSPIAEDPYFLKVAQNTRQAAQSIVMIFPAVNFIFASFSAHIAFNLYARMKRVQLLKYRLPDGLVWVLIAGFALIFVNQTQVRHTGLNLILIMMTLYAYQGFDIVAYWMIRLRIFPIIRALIFVFIFSEPPAIILIALLGLFSVWFNLYGKQDKIEEQPPSDSQN